MDDREKMRLWVENWKQTGPILEEIRRKEIRELDTRETIASLERAFNYATGNFAPRSTSGIAEMQDWFAKLRR